MSAMPTKFPSVKWITASLHKAGNRPAENEDAAAAAKNAFRFAVSDGATEGWESGPWAARLVAAYIAEPPEPANFHEWVEKVRQKWEGRRQKGPVSWYATEKRDEGSFATLIGLELGLSKSNAGWKWRTMAVGDSCLLHVQAGKISAAFPMASPEAFGNRPSLIPSSSTVKCPTPELLAGRANPGDLLLLATDAVAASLLSLSNPDKWIAVLKTIHDSIQTGETAALVKSLKAFQDVKNDDMTLTAIRLPDIPELS